jgi:hypothetical protein
MLGEISSKSPDVEKLKESLNKISIPKENKEEITSLLNNF